MSAPLMENLSHVSPGDLITVQPMIRSGLKGAPVLQLHVKMEDSSSKISQSDNLLLAYVKQTLSQYTCSKSLLRS